MLKPALALLVVANLGFWVWSEGWLGGAGGPAGDGERDSQRLTRQVEAHRVRLLAPARVTPGSSSGSVTPAATPASAIPAVPASSASGVAGLPAAAPACLQAGPFAPEDVAAASAAVRAAVPALGPDQLVAVAAERPGRWIVYMGRYAGGDAVQRKQDELKRRQIPFETLQEGPAELVPGLTLGSYARRDEAESALARQELRGIRSARVVTLASPGMEHRLRVERAQGALPAELLALRDPALKGQGFSPCPAAAASGAASSAPAASAAG